VSRPPDDVIAEARWLAAQGARELVLVSENSTSYGKDLGDVRALEALLPRLAAVEGVERVRITYLQPAEMRPSLISTIAATPGVAPYFDMSFQHANADVLRRMRRFGGTDSFLALLDGIRAACPEAGVRSNVIVGFPGERDEDVDELVNFLAAARLDAIGVFAYSDEEDTEAAGLPGKVDEETLAGRLDLVRCVADELMNQRAESRTGETLEVLVESAAEDEPGGWHGRAAHQGPDVDGTTRVVGVESAPGELVRATAVATDGIDLIARVAVGP
jgi:MiaB/RimO family radical SAM methylthiotransferase